MVKSSRCGRIAICNAHQLLKNYDAVRLLMMAGASGRSLRGRKRMVVPSFKWKPKTNNFYSFFKSEVAKWVHNFGEIMEL